MLLINYHIALVPELPYLVNHSPAILIRPVASGCGPSSPGKLGPSPDLLCLLSWRGGLEICVLTNFAGDFHVQ